MREVGVRELKASLSQVLRLVRDGERVRVTVRGQAVADIVPPGGASEEDALHALVRQGRLVPPTQPHPRRAPHLARAHERPASAIVLDERESSR